ncbi:MAG: peptidoglycan-binding protein [Gammaproteobacteria bacterium]|nr:peptidoglycan-binding protein [Gammaproteobacteria bacterium]
MRNQLVPLIALSVGLSLSQAHAQSTDDTTLPDAKPGECFAKVITPAKFETRTEEVVIQEAAERIETVPAKFETVEQTVLISEASQILKVVPATYETVTEQVEVRAAETNWTTTVGNKQQPASPGALEGIVASGIKLDEVKPGACFSEFYTAPEYRTETQLVLKSEASENISATPAKYETVEERVVVKEASSRLVDVPAVYRTETESVLVEPARSVWKKGRGPVERIDDTTGEIMCLVEIPARYQTITKTVLEKPATTKTVTVPAVYKTIKVRRIVTPASESRAEIKPEYESVMTRVKVADSGFFWLEKGEKPNGEAQASGRSVCLTERAPETQSVKRRVVKTPASVTVQDVPAQYETIKVQRLVSPATEKRVTIPARTSTVTSQVQVAPSSLAWRKVLCETNMTPNIILGLQRALKREGYDPGPIDGVVGGATRQAVEEYQLKNNLDRGGLTYETLKALKVQS